MNIEPADPRPARSVSRRALLGCALGLLVLGFASSAAAKPGERPLFESEASLAVSLQAPWPELLRRPRDAGRRPALLSYTDEDGQTHRIEASVETRGLTRLRLCRFPPLRLRFERAATQGTVFEGQRSLKLVTHCDSGQTWEQYYIREWLAYRIYNLLSEHSFRVRALDITYLDAEGEPQERARFGFVIENLRDLTRRTGHQRSPQLRFSPSDFDAQLMGRFMLFQYLIGNTDWSVLSGPKPDACCHNVRMIAASGTRGFVAVPYDFDSAGLVNARYAAPSDQLRIRYVTQRLFRGFCAHASRLQTVREEFLGQREAILRLVSNERRLTDSRRRASTRYLEDFFETLEDSAAFAREISGKCRS